jgi:hypothetical protein
MRLWHTGDEDLRQAVHQSKQSLLSSFNAAHVLTHFPDEAQNLLIGRGALSKVVQLFLIAARTNAVGVE